MKEDKKRERERERESEREREKERKREREGIQNRKGFEKNGKCKKKAVEEGRHSYEEIKEEGYLRRKMKEDN